jgi:hypothetical protein
MLQLPGKSEGYLDKAIRSLQIADHMLYVTYPLFNERKLLLKIFDEINKSVVNCVNHVISRENFSDRIGNWDFVFNRFLERNVRHLGFNNEEVSVIKEIVDMNKKHKGSAMEFVRGEKVVIMGDDLGVEAIDVERIKKYLRIAKELLVRVRV